MTAPGAVLDEADEQHQIEPNVLYRFFSATDELLYIGITNQFGTRLKAHGREKRWFREVAHIRVEHFDSREEVEEAERQAIAFELPRWNVQGIGPARRQLIPGIDAVWLGIQAFKLKLGARMHAAEKLGEHTVVTRRGEPVGVLVPMGWYRRVSAADNDPTEF